MTDTKNNIKGQITKSGSINKEPQETTDNPIRNMLSEAYVRCLAERIKQSKRRKAKEVIIHAV